MMKKYTPCKSFAVPLSIINERNKYEHHSISLASELGFTRFYIDNADKEIGSVNLNPLGKGDIGAFVR